MKTFRGLLADGAIDKIYLAGDEPGDGYRIAKLHGMANAPGAADGEHIIKIYKILQTAVDGVVDLSDNTLIASLYFTNRTDTLHSNENVIIADNEIFNQDIFITHSDIKGSAAANYYIELEQVKLSNGEQAITNFVAALEHGE